LEKVNPNKLLTVLSAALLAFAVLSTAPSLKAQSSEPQKSTSEVQQLKERLVQLEQTVELLKTQLTSMEDFELGRAGARRLPARSLWVGQYPVFPRRQSHDRQRGDLGPAREFPRRLLI
jgi:hypothetical protein